MVLYMRAKQRNMKISCPVLGVRSMWAASAARRFFRAAPSWARHGSVIAAASLAVTCADRLHFTTEAEKPAEYVHDTVSVTEPIRPPTRKDIADRSKKIKIFGGRHNAELAEQIGERPVPALVVRSLCASWQRLFVIAVRTALARPRDFLGTFPSLW